MDHTQFQQFHATEKLEAERLQPGTQFRTRRSKWDSMDDIVIHEQTRN